MTTIIVGGGPAGSAAAWTLARSGGPVQLLERDAAPRDKICGEFLSIEAQAVLRDMGLDPAALGAPAINRLRLVHGSRVAEVDLPFRAYGLTRRAMDAAMLERAAAAGAEIRGGTLVRRVDGLAVEIQGDRLVGSQVILASGKHDVRGAARVSRGTASDLIGFKAYFHLTASERAALAGHIEVFLYRDGYAGLQLVEGGRANLCLLIGRDRFGRLGGWPQLLDWLQTESAHLADRLRGARSLLDRPLTIAGVPYGFRYRPRRDDPAGLFRVGDQAAVIPSFSGDGMAIAMHSGRAAAEAILAGEDARHFHARQRARFAGQIRVAQAAYRLAQPPVLQPLLIEAARRWPGLAARLASWTRVPYSSNRSAPSCSISDESWVT